MSGIRVGYSGLMAFVIRLVSVITGLIFTVIVTRNLTPEEFGLWKLIGSLILYVMIIEPITSFWVSRYVVRGEQVAKTGFATNGLFSIVASIAYIGMIYFVAGATNSRYDLLFVSTILIPVSFISNTLESINLGFKPQATSFSFLAFELVKIPSALLLVEVGHMGLAGAIYATFIAYAVRNTVSFSVAKTKMQGKLDFGLVKHWLKLAWLPLYTNVASLIFNLDVLIFSLMVGSVKSLSFYAAAYAISVIVSYSAVIAQALYPKLIADNRKEYLEHTLKRVFSFAIPLLAAVIIFAKPSLFVLNPVYVVAEPVVYIYAMFSFAYALWSVLHSVLIGIERVDINMNSTFSDYVKSKLFVVPTLTYIQYGTYVGLLALMLFIAKKFGEPDINLIIFWAIIALTTQLPFTVYFWKLTVRYLSISFPIKNVARYSLASIVAGALMYFLNGYILISDGSIFAFAPRLAVALSIGGAIYFSVAYSIDDDFKSMTKGVIRELTSMRK